MSKRKSTAPESAHVEKNVELPSTEQPAGEVSAAEATPAQVEKSPVPKAKRKPKAKKERTLVLLTEEFLTVLAENHSAGTCASCAMEMQLAQRTGGSAELETQGEGLELTTRLNLIETKAPHQGIHCRSQSVTTDQCRSLCVH